MLQIPVAIVSSLGETGLKVICPADCQNEAQATGDMALLGHEAELHYHSQGIKAKVWPRKNHRRNLSKMWMRIPVLLTRCF